MDSVPRLGKQHWRAYAHVRAGEHGEIASADVFFWRGAGSVLNDRKQKDGEHFLVC